MKKISLTLIVLILTISPGLSCLCSLGWAQPQFKKNELKKPKTPSIRTATKAVIKTDLQVIDITSIECPAGPSLPGVDAFYVKDIWARVGNYACSKGEKASVAGTFKATYFDLMKNKLVTITQPFHQIPHSAAETIQIIGIPLLIKKSTGIKVEITPKQPIQDCNMSNNLKIVNQCNYDPIR